MDKLKFIGFIHLIIIEKSHFSLKQFYKTFKNFLDGMSNYSYLFKFIIIGDSGNPTIYNKKISAVGKSCLLL
jgi:hypothetical protein